MKVWDRAGIKLTTPGSAVRHASVDRPVTDFATQPSQKHNMKHILAIMLKYELVLQTYNQPKFIVY